MSRSFPPKTRVGLVSSSHLLALFCSAATLLCALATRPFAETGIGDDGPYIVTVKTLAATGHLAYTGWSTAMLGWQLYLGAAFVRLFGFSFTSVRMSTLLVAVALAFLLHRTMVRSGITADGATFGTLAIALSPLFLTLSLVFMTDIQGLFALTICLYACLRALQASSTRSSITWLCFAVAANVICGSSRQIAWLGVLVMVPSALWLLRANRQVLYAGLAATLLGDLGVFAAMRWFHQQPYSIPEHLVPTTFPILFMGSELARALLELPFLLLPIAVLFLFEIRKARPRAIIISLALLLGYLFIAAHHRFQNVLILEPSQGIAGDWIAISGSEQSSGLIGTPPQFIPIALQAFFAFLAFGGLIGLIVTFRNRSALLSGQKPTSVPSLRDLAILLGPFTAAYLLLLIPRATSGLFDRYIFGLTFAAAIISLRYFQDRLSNRLPSWSAALVCLMALYAIATVHNRFAFFRARIALVQELLAAGVPETAIDSGWEHNFDVELRYAESLNDDRIVTPPHAIVEVPTPPEGHCHASFYEKTPHIHPLYGIAFDPLACAGPAPFAPVTYARWLSSTPGKLYVVRY